MSTKSTPRSRFLAELTEGKKFKFTAYYLKEPCVRTVVKVRSKDVLLSNPNPGKTEASYLPLPKANEVIELGNRVFQLALPNSSDFRLQYDFNVTEDPAIAQ